MYRFFENVDFLDYISLNRENSHHFNKVLRIKNGEEVEIVANNGVFLASFHEIKDEIVILKKIERLDTSNESSIELVVAQGILKGDKMDELIKNLVEVGISKFIPLTTKRVISNIKGKEEKKLNRWKKILESGAKQSKRDIIPTINFPIELNDLDKFKDYTIIVPYEDEKLKYIDEVLNIGNKILLVIGPEGGFEKSEIEYLKSIDANIVTLGRRILRAETAALCSSFYIIHKFERRD